MIFAKRQAGILLHPTSLPSPYGIGDLGPSAYRFVDILKATGNHFWQVLPLVIPDVVGSPYATASAFAGNWLLVSPELFAGRGFLPLPVPGWSEQDEPVHYRSVAKRKEVILAVAFEHFRSSASPSRRARFSEFRKREGPWLKDFSLFMALKERFGLSKPWTQWPKAIRQRRPEALKTWSKRLRNRREFHEFCQWVFSEQWSALKRYANERGIRIIGDLPLFVTRDSADTWSDPRNFMLDHLGRPRLVAGVPPDYFSSRGQVWGDPLYHWKHVASEGFQWWIRRFQRSLDLYDIIRLDHFRGYVNVWGIRAGSRSSRRGSWHPVPGQELFSKLQRAFPRMQCIAEDLGVITEDIVAFRNSLRFPGVRVLQFGFHDLGSIHALENVSRRSVVYTGTHDNNTTQGWLRDHATRRERKNLRTVFGRTTNEKTIAWRMIRGAMKSRANVVIVPIQDILNVGSEARLNTPGTRKGNWQWRWDGKGLTPGVQKKLRALVRRTRR